MVQLITIISEVTVMAKRTKGVKATLFFLVLLHDRFVKLGDGASLFDTHFCMDSRQVSVCPTPAPFDFVNMQAFAGEWYQIGINAQSKFNARNGMVTCNSGNYTVTSTPPNFFGISQSNLSIVESGVNSTGLVGQYGISQISTASRKICQNARQICSLKRADGQLGQALKQLDTISTKLLLPQAVEASQLVVARVNILEAMYGIDTALDGLSKNVMSIQSSNAQVIQANGSLQENLKIINNVTVQTEFVQDAIQESVRTIASARGSVIQVMVKLRFAGGVDMSIGSAVTDLGNTIALLESTEKYIVAKAGQIQLELFGINAVTPVISLQGTIQRSPQRTTTGIAVQDSTHPGRSTFHMGKTTRPWLVLGVDGWPWSNPGYNAALVYSCLEVPNGGPYDQALVVLSR